VAEDTAAAGRGAVAPGGSRTAILEAAARTIAAHGVRGLRVEEVAAEAGVSAPLLYYHFHSRSGLVKAALEAASEQAPSTVLRGGEVPGGMSGYEALEAALLAELGDDAQVRHNAVVWGEVSASAVFDPELREDVARVTETWRAEVAEGIRAGIADGSIVEVDPAATAEILITLVDGLCARWLAGTIARGRAREILGAELRGRLRAGYAGGGQRA
jgi:AcrR family transcriptional regulator